MDRRPAARRTLVRRPRLPDPGRLGDRAARVRGGAGPAVAPRPRPRGGGDRGVVASAGCSRSSSRDSRALGGSARTRSTSRDAPRFPTVRSAVVVAMVVVASPYLSRPTAPRRPGARARGRAIDALYIDRAFPTDLLGAVVLGWGVAAAVHYALRHADRAPDRRQVVTRALTRLDLERHRRRAGGRATGRAGGLRRDRARTARCASPRSAATRPTRSSSLARGATSPGRTRPAPCCGPVTSRWSTRRTSSCSRRERRTSGCPASCSPANAGPVAAARRAPRPRASTLFDAAGRARSPTRCSTTHGTRPTRLRDARIAHGKLDGHHLSRRTGTQTVVTGFEWATTSAGFGQAAADVAQPARRDRRRRRRSSGRWQPRIAASTTRPCSRRSPCSSPSRISGWTHDAFGGPQRARRPARGAARSRPRGDSAPTRPSSGSSTACTRAACSWPSARSSRSAVLFSRVGDPEEFWDIRRRTPTGGTCCSRSCSASAPTSRSASRSSATCRSGSRSGRASSCSRRCRSRTWRCRWPPTPRSRCASCRSRASTSRPRSRRAACSARSPRSSCRSGCSSSRSGSRRTRSTSVASTPARSR